MTERDERDVRDLLAGADPPEHDADFWDALDHRIDLVGALRAFEPPEHGVGFWATFDARLQAEPDRNRPRAEVVTIGSTIFGDALESAGPPAHPARASRARRRLTHRRLQRLVQLSAAAAVVAVLAGAVAWWGTREDDQSSTVETALAASSTTTTTIPAPPPTTTPRSVDPTPLRPGTVPIGASPDGRYLYSYGPAQSNDRCVSGVAANWLYAEPIDGSARRRILTDRVFSDPQLTVGPSAKVVVSDSCIGSTRHLIASAEANGALSVDRTVLSGPSTPLAVEGAAWSASGTGLFLRGEGTTGWFRYDLANGGPLQPVQDVATSADVVEQLANDQFVSVTRRNNATTWAVSVGTREVVAISAPAHRDLTRAVRIDPFHQQVAIAGADTLLVLSVLPQREVSLANYRYEAEAITWSADGTGLVAAPRTGGLEYLSFTPSAGEQLATVALGGFDGITYDLLTVPTSSTLVVRKGVAKGSEVLAGEALLLELAG
jgi:hypothetical protein